MAVVGTVVERVLALPLALGALTGTGLEVRTLGSL